MVVVVISIVVVMIGAVIVVVGIVVVGDVTRVSRLGLASRSGVPARLEGLFREGPKTVPIGLFGLAGGPTGLAGERGL